LNLFLLPIWLLRGRAAFKGIVASKSDFSADSSPYREDLLDYLYNEKKKGRRLILATASNKSMANKVARHLGIFDVVIATENEANLKGNNKLKAIRDVVDVHRNHGTIPVRGQD
jgi:phosphoserine phosphatase